jgi:ABC-type Zn2+ transport system substrate-binding protein/surface adhesin
MWKRKYEQRQFLSGKRREEAEETDRQTDRQTDTHTHTHTQRERERERERERVMYNLHVYILTLNIFTDLCT